MVVAQRLTAPFRQRALHPVNRRPMHDHAVVQAAVFGDPVDAEERPHRVEQPAELALHEQTRHEQRRDTRRESNRTATLAECQQRRHRAADHQPATLRSEPIGGHDTDPIANPPTSSARSRHEP